MNAGGAEPLIVSSADDPSSVDHCLQTWHAVIDLLCRLGREVVRQLARRVGLRRGACGIAEAGCAVAPRDDWASLTGSIGCDHEPRHLVGGAGQIG